MLAWFGLDETAAPGDADEMLATLAAELTAEGWRLAGAVQHNLDRGADCACDMELALLAEPQAPPIRISQSLGSGSTGCRLDTGALEEAAGRVAARLTGAELVILPKFGRQEAVGRGFRDVIGTAMMAGQPLLLHVPRQQRAAFAAFAGDLAEELAPADIAGWARARRG